MGRKLDAKKDLRAQMGAYIKASCDTVITNDMLGRINPCRSLGTSGNMQRSVKYFDILTSEIFTHCTLK